MDLSELERLENPAKVLKLSEAIRIGAKIRPQLCNGGYMRDGKSCAFGAAAEVLDIAPSRLHANSSKKECEYYSKYGSTITRDNDSGMTREAIAERLEAMDY